LKKTGVTVATWRAGVREVDVSAPTARQRQPSRSARTAAAVGSNPAAARAPVARLLQELETETIEAQCALATASAADDRLQLAACQALLDQASCCAAMAAREHRAAERRMLLEKGLQLLGESRERRRDFLGS
jgi:hypothetical protein